MLVYDATVQPAHERTSGPGNPLAHAYPENSRVALCGALRSEEERIGHGRQCPACRENARMGFVAR